MSKYILVKHDTIRKSHDHYDLRFEIPNSKNWASFVLTELPPLEPGKRVYVPRSNDHDKKTSLFIGIIPEGEYGAGKLTKVESGNCDILKFTNAHIIVNFHGKKLEGTYHFINAGLFSRKKDFSKKIYSFFKAKGEINLVEEYLIFLDKIII